MQQAQSVFQRPVSTLLMLSGLIPFVAYAVLEVSDLWDGTEFIYQTREIALAYALMILSFMAGVHWGQHLDRSDKWQRWLPFASNAVALLGWISFVLLSNQVTMLIFALLFLVILAIDWLLSIEQIIDRAYFRLRSIITLIVCLSLLASAWVY